MTGAEALALLNISAARRITGTWELRARARGGELEYQVAVRCHRRRADGSIGKRWTRPIYSDWQPILADRALIEAAELVLDAHPEVAG